jgi:ABC-type uncharacterized transport system ATPase subunit
MEQYLEFNGIGKAFPGVQALKDISFRVQGGRVMALVGENAWAVPIGLVVFAAAVLGLYAWTRREAAESVAGA